MANLQVVSLGEFQEFLNGKRLLVGEHVVQGEWSIYPYTEAGTGEVQAMREVPVTAQGTEDETRRVFYILR